jgi:hypothetical protein
VHNARSVRFAENQSLLGGKIKFTGLIGVHFHATLSEYDTPPPGSEVQPVQVNADGFCLPGGVQRNDELLLGVLPSQHHHVRIGVEHPSVAAAQGGCSLRMAIQALR